MPPKYVTREEMIEIVKRLEEQDDILRQQSNQLKEILFCLKGSESLNFEGVIPAQKRITKMLDEINLWKAEISQYLGILTSKKVWRFFFILSAIFAGLYFGLKYGWDIVIKFAGKLL